MTDDGRLLPVAELRRLLDWWHNTPKDRWGFPLFRPTRTSREVNTVTTPVEPDPRPGDAPDPTPQPDE